MDLADDALEEACTDREILDEPFDAEDLVARLRALVDRLGLIVGASRFLPRGTHVTCSARGVSASLEV